MKCCENCFLSNYLKEIISSNSKIKGTCDYCGSISNFLVEPNSLAFQFKNLIELYIPVTKSIPNPNLKPNKIEYKILEDFPLKIFNLNDKEIVKKLLIEIIKEDLNEYKQIFKEDVLLGCFVNPQTRNQAEILKISWDRFADEIKSENRYHITNVIDLEKIKNLLKRHEREYKKGKVFYRARISDKNGFPTEKMWQPPSKCASAGRANPQGISYLYLSNDILTTLYETRAYLFDYVTVAEFKLINDISIINLRETKIYDPMVLAEKEELDDFLIHLPFISHLENELSKPIRKNDNELDYYPTQYLCEFIKSINRYDGIEYASSLNPDGYNFAVFSPDKFNCINTNVEEIGHISFKYNHVK